MWTLQFVFGLIAGAALTASCWHVSKFYEWLKNFEKPKSLPALDLSTLDTMTLRKVKEIIKIESSPSIFPKPYISGIILTNNAFVCGSRTVVELGGVRTFTKEEFWEVMHPNNRLYHPVNRFLLNQQTQGNWLAGDLSAEQFYTYTQREESTEGWQQEKFDFTKIRSVKDTIADLQELVDLTAWQQDTVSRAVIWLSGLAEVNNAWWTQFIELVDLLTDKPDDDHTRESLIKLVSRVLAPPVSAH